MKNRIALILSFICLFHVLTITDGFAQVKKSLPVKKKVTTTKKVIAKPTTVKGLSNVRVKITTDSGVIIVKLSDSTPNHRNNFVKLVKQHFYDSLLFHRVIANFMIQGGDPTSKYAPSGTFLGNGGDSMPMIPAEFRPYLFHKRGVLAAARNPDNVNPTKASSACQFYIVTGREFSDDELSQIELRLNRTFTPAERLAYTKTGGTPWLDQGYTVFGEVESGMEVIDKISSAAKDGNDRPLNDIRMKIEIIR